MRLYHRSATALVVRQRGFRFGEILEFSDTPVSAHGAESDQVTLVFEVPESIVTTFEREHGEQRRVFRIPPEIANTFFPIVDQLSPQRARRIA